MNASEPAISTKTRRRLTPPSFQTSPRRKREPRRTMPAFSQNSYVATPGLKISARPKMLEMARPSRMAQRTYSMLGKVQ
jgi:hypothetical protein